MRLTLRTLLAYMDGILEARDAQHIGKRIQQSEFASGLLQRIQEVTQRLRITGTDASERGAGMDANTIAEYLDNTMPAGRVPDFEKVCLESDAHLAEVASCHQILTLVLGEPAEVNPESRQRMYSLLNEAAAEPVAAVEEEASGDGQADQQDGKVAVAHHGKEIPEYLREIPRRRRRARLAAVLVLVVGLGVAVLAATGQFRPGTPLGNLLPQQAASLDSTVPGVAVADKDKTVPPVAPNPEAENKQVGVVPDVTVVPPAVPEPEVHQPVHPAASQPVSPGPVAPLPGAPVDSALEVTPPSVPVTPAAATPVPVDPLPQTPGATPAPTIPAQPAEETSPASSSLPMEPKPAPTQPGIEAPPAEPVAARPAIESPAIPREPAGEYVSTTEVLVRLTPEARWQRVPSQAVLSVGDEVLSFPTYRPSFNLSGGVGVQLFDGTRVVLLKPNPEGHPGLDVRYGRLIVKAGQGKDTALSLQFGPRTATVRFSDAESMVMVEVGRPVGPGADPQAEPSPPVMDLYVTSGGTTLQQDSGGEPIALNAPMKLRLDDKPPEPVAAQELPTWGSPDAVSLLDRRASATVGPSLSTDRSIELTLRELTGHRQKEVRWLAMRCLGHLGDFGPMIKGLDDPEQKLVWQDYIDQLRTALTRGPQAAASIRSGMEGIFGDNGTILYELLWKHRKSELTKADATRLVNLLEHSVLAVRVLSFWNLREATGLSLYYRPEYPAAKRLTSVQKWRERMEVPIIQPSNDGSGTITSGEESAVTPPVLPEEAED